MADLDKHTYDVIIAKLREAGYDRYSIDANGDPVDWVEAELSHRVIQPKVYHVGPFEITDDRIGLTFRRVK